jgi:hypothetical protein
MTETEIVKKPASIFAAYERDTKRDEEGVWTKLSAEGVEVKLRSLSSDYYADVVEKLQKPHLALIRKRKLPNEVGRQITIKAICQGLLVDWKGVIDRDGKEIAFNPTVAYNILSLPSMKDLAEEILGYASEAELFKQEEKEDTEKNLESTSAGS